MKTFTHWQKIVTKRYPKGRDDLFHILLVESKPDEVSPFVDSFKATGVTEEVHVVSDGEEALDFIHQRDDYTQAPRPNIILLDLHISGVKGEEILMELKRHPELKRIPVLVITTSDAEEDIARSYQLNANAYLQKPDTADEFAALAQAIEDFWLTTAHLPPT